ncbi:hypothetical protein [Microcoleus sp. B9-D4]
MPVPQNLIFLWNGHLVPLLGTGKMPVPQNLILFLVERASCPFTKELFLA